MKNEIDLSDWESPITQFETEIASELVEKSNGELLLTVKKALGFKVDEKELLKCLEYDRNQYSIGYKNGFEKAMKKTIGKMMESLDNIALCMICDHFEFGNDNDFTDCKLGNLGYLCGKKCGDFCFYGYKAETEAKLKELNEE